MKLLIGVAVLALGLSSSSSSDFDDLKTVGRVTDDGGYSVALAEKAEHGGEAGTTVDNDGTVRERLRAPACQSGYVRHDLTPICVYNDPIEEECLDGSTPLNPMWERTAQVGDGEWGNWRMISWYYCANDVPLENAIRSAWTRMKPLAPDINLQPDTGWVFATVPTVAFVDDSPVIHHVVLLGIDVRIRATPSTYTWTWGDGDTTITGDAGSPYPNYSLSHTYMYFEGDVTVELATSWTGDYSIAGGEWTEISGIVHTTSTPVPLTVYNPHTHLVDCDTNGNCTSGLPGPAQ